MDSCKLHDIIFFKVIAFFKIKIIRIIQRAKVRTLPRAISLYYLQDFHFLTIYENSSSICSISGSSATIYAYLSEFHDTQNRSRAIMGAALIFGLSLPLLPLAAYGVINQDWEFDVPLIDVVYKPWRLYLVVCSLPGLMSSIVIFFLPESPKFVLGQGDQAKAIEILESVNRWNNGKHSTLGLVEIYEENESIESRARIQKCKQSRFPLLESVWIQTAPLFQRPYLTSMVLICVIQFSIFYVSTGYESKQIYLEVEKKLNSSNCSPWISIDFSYF